MIDLGIVKPGSTIRIPFSTFDSNDPQASSAITNYAVADIKIHKNGSTTERASTAGFTATASFDTLAGINLAVIDLSDNTTTGFYAAGAEYLVTIADVTLDAATVRKTIGRFVIGYPDAILNTTIATLASQTSFTLTNGPAEDDALNGMWVLIHDVASAVQFGKALISDYTGSTRTVVLVAGTTFTAVATDNISIMDQIDSNVVQWSAILGSNDDYPSTQSQVGNIAVGSASIGYNATGFTPTTGSETLTYAATTKRDGILHEIAPDGGNTSGYYTLTLPGNGVVNAVKWAGYIQSNGDSVEFQFYDWIAAEYVTENTVNGTNGTTIIDESTPAVISYTGTGANLGQVRFRFLSTTSTNIATDRLIFEATVIAQSVGYANGAIWFDSNVSNENTEVFVDGTADNPVSTEAAVNTLIASTGLTRVEVAIDSTIAFTTSHTSEFWTGEHWVLAHGGQDVSSSHFNGADVSGVGTGTTPIDYERCRINTATLHRFHMTNCGFDGTLTLGETGNYVINNGHSAIAGPTTPIIDTGAALANVNLTMPDWHNGVEIRNLNNAGTDLFSISGIGQIIYAATSSGAVNQRGRWKVTNTGGVTITYDDPSQNEIDTLADTNDLQTNQGDWLTATGFSTHSAANVRTEMDDNSTQLAAIAEDTAELQQGIIYGAAATGTLSISQATTNLTGYTDDQLIGRTIIVTSGPADGEGSDITDSANAGGLLTFTAMTLAMGDGNTFKIV